MQKSYRTKSRDDIMSYIEKNKEKRFSASDVYNYLRELGSTTDLTTVYRNLEKMIESGILLQLANTKDGSALYQYSEPEKKCQEHLHIQCSGCGKIYHLDEEFMGMVEKYFDNHGFTLKVGESVLVGICESCRN